MSRTLLIGLLLLITACPVEVAEEIPPPLPDAGDEAFVRRVVPIVWGRNPLSVREVDVLVAVIDQSDRETLVRAMTTSPEYVNRWSEVLMDSLFINRTGERGNGACYGRQRLESDDADLARFVRDHTPLEGEFDAAWTMADLIRSALWLDDVTPIFRAHLFAQMAKDIPLQGVEAAEIVRRNLWELFEQTYLNRQLSCMPCHNSEWSITDNAEPELDRSWPMKGHFEEALFGDHTGRDPEELYTLFRKHEVLGGYNVFEQQYDVRPTGCIGDQNPGCDGCACEEYVCDERPQCCTDNWDPTCVALCNEADVGCTPRLPDDFDGCTALYGYEGCGECECGPTVCAALPQCCNGSWTEFCAERCRLWFPDTCEYPGGYYDYWDFGEDAVAPWGMHDKCGMFNPPGTNGPDPLNQDSYFIDAYGPEVTIWDVERPLHQGVDDLRDGLDLNGNKPSGPEAFAFLVSARIAEVAWQEVHGSSLTVPNHFPRNAAQRDTLQSFTEAFYSNDYSLVELIVRASLHVDFNAVAPADLGEGVSPYGMERVHNPWVAHHEEPELRANNPGDVLHRRHPRVLVNAATQALGWPDWPDFPAEPDAGPEGRLQEYLGFFLKDSIQGFRGNDFQGLAAWEFAFGACHAEPEAADGCSPRAGAGCDGCACEYAVCIAEPECCDVRWDQRCTGFCGDTFAGCEEAPDTPPPDPLWLEVLIDEVEAMEGVTLEEAVAALKDRLLADPSLSDGDERALLEDLLGYSLETPWGDVSDREATLKWACSAFLASPQFQLTGIPMPDVLPSDPEVVVPGSAWSDFCANAADLFDDGELACGDGSLALSR